MKKNVNSSHNSIPIGFALLVSVAFLCASCGATENALKKEVSNLSREIVQLKAEKTNLSAKNRSLDEKLVLIENRKDSCQKDQIKESKLRVVRLTAAQDRQPDEERR